MKKVNSFNNSPAVQIAFLFGLTAASAMAQSGDISASTAPVVTLGVTILKAVLALAVLGCIGVIIYGAVSLGGNRPRGLAMIASGVAGSLICGLSYALVATTSGANAPTSMILVFR